MKITPQLRQEIEQQLPDIERKTEELWQTLKKIEGDMAPWKAKYDDAQTRWAKVYNEREQLRAMLQE